MGNTKGNMIRESSRTFLNFRNALTDVLIEFSKEFFELQKTDHDDLINFKKAWVEDAGPAHTRFFTAGRVTSKTQNQIVTNIIGVGQSLSFPP
jgi:hypothetical protein